MAQADFTSVEAADANRKISRLSFEPTNTPDMIVVKSFSNNKKIVAPPPFPRLHPTMVMERAQPFLRQQEEERRRKPPAIISLPPPTTPWYPEQPRAPILGKPLTPNIPTSLSSPRAQQRIAARQEICATIVAKMNGSIPTNCQLFYGCLCNEMSEKGTITAVQLTNIFKECSNLTDITLVDSFFQLLDVRRKGQVAVLSAVAALDTIFNGQEQDVIRRACFEPFNLDQRGYIHKSHLDSLKAAKDPLERDPLCTPEMVKVLNDVFIEIGKEEEEAFLLSLSKGKKAKKKAPPLKQNQKSIIPCNRMRVGHMSFQTFDRFFTSTKSLGLAFARCWLPVVEDHGTVRLHIVQRIQDLTD